MFLSCLHYFLNLLWIWDTCHKSESFQKCAIQIMNALILWIKDFRGQKLFKGGNYSRKYCIWKFWNQKKSCNRQIRPVWSSQGVWTPHTTAGEAAAAWSGGNFKEPRENWALHQYDLCSGQNLTLLHSISEKNNQSLCISLKKKLLITVLQMLKRLFGISPIVIL